MKRVEIHRIDVNEGGVFSQGVGEDTDNGDMVNFIGYTGTMKNILLDLMDFEEHPEHGRPAIYLEAWQQQ
jgi:ABC-type histidine transport system ATPase subunit